MKESNRDRSARREVSRRVCTICNRRRQVSCFHGDSRVKSGLRSSCKDCDQDRKRYSYNHNSVFRRRHNNYQRRYRATSDVYARKLERLRQNRKRKKLTRLQKDRNAQRMRAYRARHPDRIRARNALIHALQSGKIAKPDHCPCCGKPERKGADGRTLLHAHHHRGYDHPLDVEWLCIECHLTQHRKEYWQSQGLAA
jgi:hypothetical protein